MSMLSGTLIDTSNRLHGILIPSGDTPDYDKYAGVYIVTPKTEEEQILNTSNKVLTDDIHVKKIPYFDVSNTSGGSTVYIGSDLEIS